MSTKKLTPLQQAIEKAHKNKFKFPADQFDTGYNRALEHIIDDLKELLPSEKEFARDMYLEGMTDHGYDNSNFFKLFKQYEQ